MWHFSASFITTGTLAGGDEEIPFSAFVAVTDVLSTAFRVDAYIHGVATARPIGTLTASWTFVHRHQF